MKLKRMIIRLLAALSCLALVAAATPERTAYAESAIAAGYVNTTKLNLRKGAGTGYSIVATLSQNTVVNVYEVSGTWLRVDVPSSGKTGYVSGKYINISASSLSAYALGSTSGRVNLRESATSKSTSLAVLNKNVGLTVYSADATTGWYKVKVHTTGKEGYISPLYVTIVSKVDGTSSVVSGTGEITADNVNFRSGPSTGYSILDKLQKLDALTILEKNGSWYKVTVHATNKTGYVYGAYVKITSSSTVTPTPTPTSDSSSGTKGTINASGVNFRTGPSTSYTKQGTFQKNTAVTILSTSGNWYKITVDATGARGYVYAAYVTVPNGSVTPTPTPAPLGSLPGKLNASGVNFRTGPSTSYTSMGLLTLGTAVTVLAKSGDWYQLTVNSTGKTGYVFAKFVTVASVTPTPTLVPTPTPTPTPLVVVTPSPSPSTSPSTSPSSSPTTDLAPTTSGE